jgi:hypothetical protein
MNLKLLKINLRYKNSLINKAVFVLITPLLTKLRSVLFCVSYLHQLIRLKQGSDRNPLRRRVCEHF